MVPRADCWYAATDPLGVVLEYFGVPTSSGGLLCRSVPACVSCEVSVSRRRVGGGGGVGISSDGTFLNGSIRLMSCDAGGIGFDGGGECFLISLFDDEAIAGSCGECCSCVRRYLFSCSLPCTRFSAMVRVCFGSIL